MTAPVTDRQILHAAVDSGAVAEVLQWHVDLWWDLHRPGQPASPVGRTRGWLDHLAAELLADPTFDADAS